MLVIAGIDAERGERVASEAARLAAAFDADLQLLHVTDSSEYADREHEAVREGETPVDFEELEVEAAGVADAAGGAIDHPYEAVGRVGEPEKVLVGAANEADASYLVVGARHRSPVGKAIFGSVTQSVLLNSDIPVLCVYPDDE